MTFTESASAGFKLISIGCKMYVLSTTTKTFQYIIYYMSVLLIPSFWSSLYHFRQTLCPSLVNVNSRFHFMFYLNGEELKGELKSNCYLAPFLVNYIFSLNKVILLAFF